MSIPRLKSPDSTLAFLRDGYDFIGCRADRLGTDVFRTRLLLRPVICMRGPEAARLFYDRGRFQRHGATPDRFKATLFGRGGVQGLDGEAHEARKAMFMALMTPPGIQDLAERYVAAWRVALEAWTAGAGIVLFPEVERLLCRAVCDWAGVPLPAGQLDRRTRELSAMIDGAGGVGPRHWRGRIARRHAESWLSDLVRRVRGGELEVPEGSPLHLVAFHRDPGQGLLAVRVAAVEVLNLLRPVVAIARYVAFIAHALATHPSEAERIRQGDGEDGEGGEGGAGPGGKRPSAGDGLEAFVQEVRRLYPFFPMVAAKTTEAFDWQGHHFPAGRRVLLDLYGTDHDARAWPEPDAFRPERFREREPSEFDLIPQGGGDHYRNHRCAGEWITIRLMKESLRLLARGMTYRVPEQDLGIDRSRIPAIPASRMVLADIRSRV